jgi:hypothetical protein
MNLNVVISIKKKVLAEGNSVLYSNYCYLVPQNRGVPKKLTLQEVLLSSESFLRHRMEGSPDYKFDIILCGESQQKQHTSSWINIVWSMMQNSISGYEVQRFIPHPLTRRPSDNTKQDRVQRSALIYILVNMLWPASLPHCSRNLSIVGYKGVRLWPLQWFRRWMMTGRYLWQTGHLFHVQIHWAEVLSFWES